MEDNEIKDTMNRVLFEDGNETFVGIPSEDTMVNSKSIVFEFAYNKRIKETREQAKSISDIIENTEKQLIESFKNQNGYEISFVVYNFVTDIYK